MQRFRTGRRNAVYAMCDWIKRLTEKEFEYKKHPILSPPTFNIGKISGGIAPNVVPADCKAGTRYEKFYLEWSQKLLGRRFWI